jgi:carbon-monoxide dehydrogenase medium subunit
MQPNELVGLRSRTRIGAFDLVRPTTVADAARYSDGADECVYMAGGVDVVGRLKRGIPASKLIFLGGIAEMRRIEREPSCIVIGAAVTHRRLAASPELRSLFPALAATIGAIANPRLRFKGTVGGNILACDPGYDLTALLAVVDARCHFMRADGSIEEVPVVDAAGHGGLLVAILIPVPESDDRPLPQVRVDRSLRPVAMVAVATTVDGGNVVALRIAVGCATARTYTAALDASCALRVGDLRARSHEIASELLESMPDPLNDWRASAAYRRRIVGVLSQRLIATGAA